MSAHRAASDLFKAPVEIQDPGNAGTITVERSPSVINVVSAGAETRTLAAPTEPGALCLLNGQTIAGTVTVTVTGGYNVAGSTTFTITAAKQWYLLQSVQESAGVYRWRLIASYGGSIGAVTPGQRVASGSIALDGSNPTPVATGLTTIVSAVATLKSTGAVSSGTAFLTVDFTGSDGTLNIYAWVLAGSASTGTETVEWVATGT